MVKTVLLPEMVNIESKTTSVKMFINVWVWNQPKEIGAHYEGWSGGRGYVPNENTL